MIYSILIATVRHYSRWPVLKQQCIILFFQNGCSVLDGCTRTDKYDLDCIRADVRISSATNCSEYVDAERRISPAFLYPPGWAQLKKG